MYINLMKFITVNNYYNIKLLTLLCLTSKKWAKPRYFPSYQIISRIENQIYKIYEKIYHDDVHEGYTVYIKNEYFLGDKHFITIVCQGYSDEYYYTGIVVNGVPYGTWKDARGYSIVFKNGEIISISKKNDKVIVFGSDIYEFYTRHMHHLIIDTKNKKIIIKHMRSGRSAGVYEKGMINEQAIDYKQFLVHLVAQGLLY